ncbi:MAG TPA: zinc-ribbon domain-containing protein [Pyrinomonadaceae bacterium]|nr:zinc-ribbon domain-containing protein [Pyrinomonadaceae bacterium]
MQPICSNCSAILDPDAVFCSACGTSVIPQSAPCPSCGKSILTDARFCKYCAFSLGLPPEDPPAGASRFAASTVEDAAPDQIPNAETSFGAPRKPSRFPKLTDQESIALVPLLIWGIIGGIGGLVSAYFGKVPIIGVFGPGIILGLIVFLFGEYSSSPPIGKRKRIISLIVLVLASTGGWYLAIITGVALYWALDHFAAFIAGTIWSTLIVLAELICWKFKLPRWIYALCVILLMALSLELVFHFVGLGSNEIAVLVIWQALVLAIHVLAFTVNKKWLVIGTTGFVLLAATTLTISTFNEKAKKALTEKEYALTEAQNARAERAQAERDKEEAQRKAEQEKSARVEAETQQQIAILITQVGRQLDQRSGYYAGQGFTKTHDYKIAALSNGETASFTLQLRSGWQYNLISACDNNCSDIDIYVYDWYGNSIASNVSRDDTPVVAIDVNRTGEYTIKVKMYKCNVLTCVYGIAAFGR